MSKHFKSHVPKPVGTTVTRAPRGKAVPREKLGRAVAGKAASTTPCGAGKTEEIGGPEGPEPTRYGDWEINGRCVDF